MAAKLYSASAVALVLGIDRSRVLRRATDLGIGRAPGRGHIMWLFSEADIDAMRQRKPGRPRKPVASE